MMKGGIYMGKSRFKNYGLWVAIAALIPLVLNSFGINVLPGNYEEISSAILGILVIAGIISNPTTDNKGFIDDGNKADKMEENDENQG